MKYTNEQLKAKAKAMIRYKETAPMAYGQCVALCAAMSNIPIEHAEFRIQKMAEGDFSYES